MAEMDVMLMDTPGDTWPREKGLGGRRRCADDTVDEPYNHVGSPRETHTCKYLFGTISKSA